MNRTPESKAFWRLLGPVLLYWGIEFAAQLIAELVLLIPNAPEIVNSAEIKDAMTNEEIQQATLQMVLKATEIFLKYQIEILAITALCTIPLTLFLFSKDRKREREQNIVVNKKAPGSKYILLFVLGLAVCIGGTCLATMANLAMASEAYQETSKAFYSAGFVVQVLCLGIIVPIAEELMYRGVLYKRVRENGGFWRAALSSTLLFAMSHGNLVQLLYAFGLGLLLAYAYEKYGSLKAPVCLHVTANMISLILTEVGVFDWIVVSPERLAVSVIICAFVGAVMFVMIQRIEEKPDTPEGNLDDKVTPDMFR